MNRQVWDRARQLPCYWQAYRFAYLMAVLANGLAWCVTYRETTTDAILSISVSLVVLGCNLLSVLLFVKGRRSGLRLETALSIGRMIVALGIGSVFFAGPFVQLSAINRILWLPLLNLARDGFTLVWLVCGAILVLEGILQVTMRRV